MHLFDVHVSMVEILRLSDEDYPVIPQIESLLGGVATDMVVGCCLNRPGTPALPSVCFAVDQRPSETRSCPSTSSTRQLTMLLRATRKDLLDST